MQELPQTISRQGKMRFDCALKCFGKSKYKPDARMLEDRQNSKADDIQEMIEALRSQLSHVRAQTAFLDLKRTEMRPDDQVSLYGFMDAQEQLKIEKSLLAGHVPILQEMMTEMKIKPNKETRRLLNEIRNNVG